MKKQQQPMRWIAPIVMFAVLAGCTTKKEESPTGGHEKEAVGPHAGHDSHGEDHGSKATTMLMVRSEPEEVKAGQPATLRLMIHDADGAMVKDFETVHEQKIHLIIVREGLDQFAHIHPQIDPNGNMTAVFTFPTGGKYWLYADHKPSRKNQATAIAALKVSGDTPPAPELKPNAPGKVTGDGLIADVSVENAATSGTTRIVFSLMESSDTPVADLEPYMGAMGHLVIISADGKLYVHAHPAEAKTTDGKVEFEAHIVKPGLYKAWGQFQRGSKVHIVPFVMQVN